MRSDTGSERVKEAQQIKTKNNYTTPIVQGTEIKFPPAMATWCSGFSKFWLGLYNIEKEDSVS
jgi:ribonucleotide reductase beta subunit family protein with ferritin-like domain